VILGTVVLAIACWAFTFGWPGGNFWVKIGLSVLAVSAESALPLRILAGGSWISSSPADAFSFMPSRLGHDIVFKVGRLERG